VTSPNPVTQAAAYQRSLLDALGGDDPAEAMAETPAILRALLEDAGEDLRTRPEAGEWSVLQLLGHIADAELVVAGRLRWILAHDRPEILPYDQDLWVDTLHRDDDPDTLLTDFEALRQANLDLWRRTPIGERSRVGIHRERGPESFELTFRLLAGHDRVHLAQARRTLETVRARRGAEAGV
jgi:DinB superfamily